AFYDSRREASYAQGLQADWQAPPRNDGASPVLHLLTVADSLMRHHPDIFPAMVFVLEPAKVRDDAAWVQWLDGLLTTIAVAPQLGERVRFVVPRTDIAPFATLTQRHRVAQIKGNETQGVVGDRTRTVGKKETVTIVSDREATIGGNHMETVVKDKTESIGEGKTLNVVKHYQTNSKSMKTTV
ncbi:bacteriophage T4 gp5 trimerisation domain-containing protein, partial [Burkholderia pseudomallei]|uniref:bacteriophage T4 gp5 trimerisation domain-containing protein n=1 Tax=Burkholderia pseudomallei TaxID=28450 RepID=UPI00399D5932